MNLEFDYSKLLGKIIEKCGTRKEFANRMGKSERIISLKLKNRVDFTQSDIMKAMNILSINDNEISIYFYTKKVQNIELN